MCLRASNFHAAKWMSVSRIKRENLFRVIASFKMTLKIFYIFLIVSRICEKFDLFAETLLLEITGYYDQYVKLRILMLYTYVDIGLKLGHELNYSHLYLY